MLLKSRIPPPDFGVIAGMSPCRLDEEEEDGGGGREMADPLVASMGALEEEEEEEEVPEASSVAFERAERTVRPCFPSKPPPSLRDFS